MIDMLKRHEIHVLRRAGHSQIEVATLAGVSRRSVQRVDTEAAVTHIDEAREREARGIGRPAKAEPFRAFVVDILARDPHLLSVEIFRRAKLKGYAGGKTALYDLISALRPKTVRPLVRFEGLAGEFSQHDFGHVDVRFLSGGPKRIHFFASRLKYSRWVEVTIVPDEQTETLVRTLVDHFAAIGGIPLLAVFDRPKTVALKWNTDGQVTEWNALFAGVALDLGLGIEVCWPSSPRQKGSIENLVGWVKGSFFKQRRFLDDADLLAQLAEWRTEVNTQRPCRATHVIPAVRLEEERPRLRVVKIAPKDLALRVPVVVGPTAAVLHDRPLRSRASAAVRAQREIDAAGTPCATRGGRLRQARETLSAAGASARARAGRAGVLDRAHASAAPSLDPRRRSPARVAGHLWRGRVAGGLHPRARRAGDWRRVHRTLPRGRGDDASADRGE